MLTSLDQTAGDTVASGLSITAQPPLSQTQGFLSEPVTSIRLLLVEDDQTDALILTRVLDRSRNALFKIDHAKSLAEAASFLQSGDYDVAIVDVNLPDARGSESFERLRSLDSRLPLLVLTGEDNDELAVHAVQSGAQDYVAKECITSGAIVRRIRMAMVRQERVVGFQAAAALDPLTGMPNRRDLKSIFDKSQASARANQSSLCVGLIDVDYFKNVNDKYGHCIGDVVLQSIAGQLTRQSCPNTWTGRFGGEEFALLLQDRSLADSILQLQRTLNVISSEPIMVGKSQIRITASGGLVRALPDESLDEVIDRCDAMLYQAKSLGRNRLEVDPRSI